MIVSITDSASLVWTAPLERAQSSIRYFVLRDWERPDWASIHNSEPWRSNVPCVFRCGGLDDDYSGDSSVNGHYVKLSAAWQWWMFDLASRIYYQGRTHEQLTQAELDYLGGKFTGVFANTTAFTNNHGFDVFQNYVLGENMESNELPAIYTLVCGGASLGGEIVKNAQGAPMLKAAHFDGILPPPAVADIDPYSDPRVFFATTITNVKVNGGYKVNRFPQYDGKDVPVPLVATRDIYYPLEDLLPYVGIKRSPYCP